MTTDFTPGPWCYENVGEKENCYAVGTAWRYDDDEMKQLSGHITSYDENGEAVLYVEAVCFLEDSSLSAGGYMHANAQLIAAAPDLLKALIWAEAAIAPFSKEPAEKSGINMIRAAIAKAVGHDT